MILLLITSLLAFPGPMINRYLIDHVLIQRHLKLLAPVIILLLAIGITNSIAGQLRGFISTRFTQEVTLHLQQKLIKRVFSFPKMFFDHIHKGYLMSRLTSDVSCVNWFISGTFVQIFIQITRLIGGICFIFYLEWRIAVPIMISLPIPFIITIFFARKTYVLSHRNRERSAGYQSAFQELISSIPLIKTFSNEKKSENKIVTEIRKNYKFANENMVLSSINSNIMNLLPNVARFFVLAFGSYWVIKGDWSIGSLLAFQQYLGFVYGPVGFLASSTNQLQNTRAGLERLASLFEVTPEENTETGLAPNNIKGKVEFNNISFSYDPKEPVLSNITFSVNPGEHWALIGLSGIGKTTLISLIMRFYKQKSGDILIDDKSISEYNVRSLRNRIGYVSQKTELLSGKIIDNIKYGNSEASLDDVIRAAKTADIHDFIDNLPDKYETNLVEGAGNLSEGQKQRLSIARALVKNPDILILDEPTASLDNVTENSIYNLLPDVVKNKTMFTIAHRLGTVKNADKIIFLRDDNKPPLIGYHNDLLKHEDYKTFFDG
ncbi:MAG TPA: ABC transporter ATP-binding protein [Victivallales bacterium]|nr:ABC transporter ATP-binding protein [Victivallales bacterium]